MKISRHRLRKVIWELMEPGAQGTPDEIMGDDSTSSGGFSPQKKAALGFINNVMDESPTADQLDGLQPQLNAYAHDKGVHPGELRSSLEKMLPPSGSDHPQYRTDAASGAVSSASGKKVYGEQMKLTKRQLKKIIKEENQRTLNESASLSKAQEDLFTSLDAYVDALDDSMGPGVPTQELKAEVLNFVDGYFEDTEYAASQAEHEEGLAAQGFKNPSYG